jgi:hypothetical protein
MKWGASVSAQKIFNPGKSDKRTANRYMDQQAEFTGNQMQQFEQMMPQFQQALSFLQSQAGLGSQGGQPQHNDVYAQRRGINIPQQDPNMGIWNNPTDRFRMGQARDDIDRYTMQQGNQMAHLLGGRGMMDSSVAGGAAQRLASDASREFARQRQDLAISAPAEQERRVGTYMQGMAPIFGMGQQAFNNYGQMAGQKMEQANQANSMLPNFLGDAAQMWAMSQGMPPMGGRKKR